jgi:TP901 family phage tail tape measure protein
VGPFELALVLTAIDRATGVIKGVQDTLSKTQVAADSMVASGTRMAASGAMIQSAGSRITGALADIVAPSLAVEDAFAAVKTVAGQAFDDVEAGLKQIGSAADAWAAAHKQSADEFVAASYNAISGGLRQAEVTAAVETAFATATATMGDGAQVTETLVTLYNNLGNKTADASKEFGRLGDVLTATQQAYQIKDMNQLNEGLKYAAPVAKTYGIELEQAAAAIGMLNSAGITGSQSGTAFRAMVGSLAKASKDLGFQLATTADGGLDIAATMANLEAKLGDVSKLSVEARTEIAKAFGEQGFAAVSAYLGETQKLVEGHQQIVAATGLTAESMATMEDTTTARWQIVNNNIDKAKRTIGDQLIPVISDAIPRVMEIVNAIGGFAERNPGLVSTVVTIAAIGGAALTVMGPILLTAGSVMMFAGNAIKLGTSILGVLGKLKMLGSFLMAHPMLLVLAAIAGIAYAIYANWEPISNFFSDLWSGITASTSAAWAGVVEFFGGIMEDVRAAFDRGWVQGIVHILTNFNAITLLANAFDALIEWLFGFSLFDAGAKILSTLVDGIKSMASVPVEAVKGVAQKIRDLLPFSPAKEGPLRDLDQIRLMETVADSVDPAPLVQAMRRGTHAAMVAVPLAAAAVPITAPLPDPGSYSASPTTVQVNITIEGNADQTTVDRLERWARDNADVLYDVVELERSRSARKRFG